MYPIERADRRLLVVLNDAMQEASRLAGARLACRPGCHDCCVGPFPITMLDAWRLRRGWRELQGRDPDRAEAVRARARRAIEAMKEGFPGDARRGLLAAAEADLDAFFAKHAALPCPALDPVTGLCDLYEARPVSCRTFGPPVRFGRETAPPCALCFQGEAPEEIERCRVEPDPAGIEDAVLARIDGTGDGWTETLVAHAIAEGD